MKLSAALDGPRIRCADQRASAPTRVRCQVVKELSNGTASPCLVLFQALVSSWSKFKTLYGARLHQPDRFVNNYGEGEANRCSA